MRLKRWLAAITLGAALAALPAAVPAASAGEGYWSPTACLSGAPLYTKWYGVSGQGVWFNTIPYGSYVVNDTFYQLHRSLGAECGYLGVPTTYAYTFNTTTGDRIQYFYNPNTPCTLLYIVKWSSGPTYAYSVPNGLKGGSTCP